MPLPDRWTMADRSTRRSATNGTDLQGNEAGPPMSGDTPISLDGRHLQRYGLWRTHPAERLSRVRSGVGEGWTSGCRP